MRINNLIFLVCFLFFSCKKDSKSFEKNSSFLPNASGENNEMLIVMDSLKFTKNDLIVIQLGNELRRFPFEKWIAWRIILPQLPGFLYFREEASPHLLPILFEVNSLREQLRLRVKDLEIEKAV